LDLRALPIKPNSWKLNRKFSADSDSMLNTVDLIMRDSGGRRTRQRYYVETRKPISLHHLQKSAPE